MNSHLRSTILAAIVTLAAGHAADAAIVVGLVVDPATTAGMSPDVSSIYSGPGTWHLFAVDDNVGDFGISTYDVELSGATAIRHTSPSAIGIQDSNGDFQQAGFDLLRGAGGSSGSSFVQASQPLPDQSPFLIIGLGQQAGSFAASAAAVQSGSTVMNGTTSPSWGNYNTIAPLNGKNWLFLAEGTYDSGTLPAISQANFTVFNNPTTFRSSFAPAAIVPEPITPTLLTPEYLAHLNPPPPPPAPPVIVPPSNPPAVVPPSVINPPAVPQPVVPPSVVTPPPVIAPGPPAKSPPTQSIVAHPVNEAVVVGMVVHPGSENGGSPGTWQLFAVDNNVGDYGISSYNVDISGAATVRHTSPSTHSIQDHDGNPVDGGFNLLRGVSGAAGSYSIHAAQDLPGQSPMLITGFGKDSGSFAAEAAARLGSTTLPTGTSPDWGDYSTISPLNGKSWLLLAEGTYDTPAPPTISQASFTVFKDPTTYASMYVPSTIIPEPITPTLLTPEYFEHLTPPPPPTPGTVEVPAFVGPPRPPILEPAQPIVVVPTPPTDDPAAPPLQNEDPNETEWPISQFVIADGRWLMTRDPSTVVPITDDFVYYFGDSLLGYAPPVEALPPDGNVHRGGLQWAMTTALAGLKAAETTIDHDGLYTNFAPSLMSLGFNGLSMSLASQDSVAPPVPTPEPGSLALLLFGPISILAYRLRRR